jgi:carbamoyltransferase|tara:strand:+ start:82 stop:1788 length:1707 start_codon:yes stop_codon:yes gene_type:complete
MKILGIANAETASACLYVDGELVAAVSEERFTRKKMDDSFPEQSIQYCLSSANIKIHNLDVISYGWSKGYPEDIVLQNIKRYESLNTQVERDIFIERIVVEQERDGLKRNEFWNWVESVNLGDGTKVEDFYHHESHAFSACMMSKFEKCAVLTCDGRGDYESLTFSLFDPSTFSLKKLFSSGSADSLGFFYGRITGLLDFKPCRHEGKITGLAAYGDYKDTLPLMKKMIDFNGKEILSNLGDFYRPFYSNYSESLVKEIGRFSREDISAAAQKHIENCLTSLVTYLYEKFGLNGLPLCLAGGVFGNVKVNQRLKELECVSQIFVQPQMGDGGLAIGSVCASLAKRKVRPLFAHSMALGPVGGSEIEINELVSENEEFIEFERLDGDDLIERIVSELNADKVVGLVRGRLEFGPRALCQRSILYKTSDSTCNDWLNERMNRTEFMPFAPVMTNENARKYLVNYSDSDLNFRFMTSTVHASNEFTRLCPAVTHIDGTARPQVVFKSKDPWLFHLLHSWYKVSGEPSLINTSFNKHEEPIVATYREAFSNLQDNVVDILILENWVINMRSV